MGGLRTRLMGSPMRNSEHGRLTQSCTPLSDHETIGLAGPIERHACARTALAVVGSSVIPDAPSGGARWKDLGADLRETAISVVDARTSADSNL